MLQLIFDLIFWTFNQNIILKSAKLLVIILNAFKKHRTFVRSNITRSFGDIPPPSAAAVDNFPSDLTGSVRGDDATL